MATAQTPSGMNNLATLIKRLEAATSRLEDIAVSIDGSDPNVNGQSGGAAGVIGGVAGDDAANGAPAAPAEPLPRSVEDFDKVIEEDVGAFVTAAAKVGGLVEEQAKSVKEAFEAERTYLLVSTKAKQPETQQPELMKELHRHTSTVDELRESNRPSPLFTHLSAVSEGIVALGWIVEKRPADYIKETLSGAQYYGNKVLKEYKEKDQSHVDFINAYYKIFRSLDTYVKDHYNMGLTWNQKDGIDAMDALKQIQSGGSATPKASAAPGPPPPPPLPNFDDSNGPPAPPPPPGAGASAGVGSTPGDMSAVFDQLNRGSAVTSGLRKVDKSEMTHKNPSLRAAGGSVPERTSSQNSQSSSGRGKSPVPNKKPDSMRTKKPSRKELEGSKWIVENFENTGNEVVEINAETNHSILISRCTKCVVKITSKANAIAVDNCTQLSLVIDSLVSSLDVIKCPKFAVQIDGLVPTVLLDQVDGAQIYLSEKGLGTEIFTSKCGAVNIVVPPKGESDDSKELAVPEQIRSVIKDGQLVSEVVEHAG